MSNPMNDTQDRKPKVKAWFLWIVIAGVLVCLFSNFLPFAINHLGLPHFRLDPLVGDYYLFPWLKITPIGLGIILLLAIIQLILPSTRRKFVIAIMLVLSFVFVAPAIEMLPRYAYNNAIGFADWKLGLGFYLLMLGGMTIVTGAIIGLVQKKPKLSKEES